MVPNVSTTIYGSSSITLKAIKQWNELQNFVKTDIFSPEMTYFKLLKSIKTYIENQQTKSSNYYYNTFSIKLTPHLLLIKILHCFGMYISPLYHSLVIICLFIYSYIFYHYHYYLFVFLFLFSFFFVLFFSINCFYLFNYLFFSSSFLLPFIGLAYCVSTTIQVFLLASKFNINIKYSIKNII